MPQLWPARENPLVRGVLHPEARSRDGVLLAGWEIGGVRYGEEWDAVELDALYGWVGIENDVEDKVTTLVCTQTNHSAGQKSRDRSSPIHTLS